MWEREIQEMLCVHTEDAKEYQVQNYFCTV